MLEFRKGESDGLPTAAIFSADGKYRYMLSRDWASDGKIIVWIMPNPSIGDEKILEATTAGCMKRAKDWGYAGMVVLNLFALIATDPDELKRTPNAVGEFNDSFIRAVANRAVEDTTYIVAWGNQGKHLDRDKEVTLLLSDKDFYCLGVNKDGSPRHPLHMSHSIRPELWRGADEFRLRS